MVQLITRKNHKITRCSNTVTALRASTRQFVSSAFSELLRKVYRNALLTNCG
jgi:hypothetical protein